MADAATVELAEQIAGLVARLLDERATTATSTQPVPVEYVTPAEAAGFVRLSPKALEHLRARGVGPRTLRASGKVRYALADLRAWMEQEHSQ